MSHSLIFTRSYEKIERRFLDCHPDIFDRYHRTLAILEKDPYHPSLRLCALEGRLSGLHAVSINLQYRITVIQNLPICRERHLAPGSCFTENCPVAQDLHPLHRRDFPLNSR